MSSAVGIPRLQAGEDVNSVRSVYYRGFHGKGSVRLPLQATRSAACIVWG